MNAQPSWWPSDPTVQARIVPLLGPCRLRWCPVEPTIKQEAALRLMGPEVFYGGAAGGGKSYWLLAAAAQFVDVPGYRALILRRTYPELEQAGGLIDVAHEWWDGTAAVWNGGRRSWTFPSGARIEFGHMTNERAFRRYKGGGYHFVGFDEATTFLQHQYEFMFSRTRGLDPKNVDVSKLPRSPDGLTVATIPIRVRAASNPGDVGHEWVKTRFVDAKTRAPGAVFIRAHLTDNTKLDQARYIESLMHLDPVTRAQVLAGDWDARPEGAAISAEWFYLIEMRELRRGARHARAWDLAATKPHPGNPDPSWTVGTRMQRNPPDAPRLFTVVDMVAMRDDAGAVKRLVRRTARADGRGVIVGVPKDPGQAGKAQVVDWRRYLAGFTVRDMPTSKDKLARATPVISALSNGEVDVVASAWTPGWTRELSGFPYTGHDDHLDSLADAHSILAAVGPVVVRRPTGRIAVRRR